MFVTSNLAKAGRRSVDEPRTPRKGFEAEERLRGKAEAFLRRRHPTARIIHELKLKDDVRIDLAAVETDFIAVAEIKSEKDTFKRLPAQIDRAVEVADCVYLFMAEVHAERWEAWQNQRQYEAGHLHKDLSEVVERHIKWLPSPLENRARYALFHMTEVLIEAENAAEPFCEIQKALLRRNNNWHHIRPSTMLGLLWADELREIGSVHRVDCSGSMYHNIHYLLEHLSGREVRRAVCRALRRREFARADDPIVD